MSADVKFNFKSSTCVVSKSMLIDGFVLNLCIILNCCDGGIFLLSCN